MSNSILCGFAAIFATLVFAAVLAAVLRAKNHSAEAEQVRLRINTWFVIIAVFAALFFLPLPAAALILAALSILSFTELAEAAKKSGAYLPAAALGLLSAVCFLSGFFLLKKNENIFFFTAVLTQLNDILQYLWGKSFGKHKILPKISPSKTWEGFLGGVITCAALSVFIAPLYFSAPPLNAFALGIVIAVCGFAGDATVSAFKRKAGIKDTGRLLAGHGGLLDRIDSLLYILPFAAVYTALFGF